MAILGERWPFVILREIFNGVRRFDDVREHSGIPRQVLSDRLGLLVEQVILRREPYREPDERPRGVSPDRRGLRPLPGAGAVAR